MDRSGKAHGECGSITGAGTRRENTAVVCFDERLGDGQSDPASALRPASGGVGTVEPVENEREMLRWDAFA